MALKTRFSDKEKEGLTDEEIRLGEKYLRKFKTAGAIPQNECKKIYELVLMGYSFHELHQQFPQYPIAKIILTAALRGWMVDRERMQSSLRDRVHAKVVKSVVEQVDYLTTMLSVVNTEHIESMRMYILDPVNNPKPEVRINSIKEYKEIADTLQKLISNTMAPQKTPPKFDALNSKRSGNKALPEGKKKEKESDGIIDIADLIADNIDGEEKE